MSDQGMKASEMGPQATSPAAKKYIIYCDCCGKQTVDIGFKLQHLTQVPMAKVPGGVPVLSPVGKVENRPSLPRPKMVKCPKCGRGVTVRSYAVPESKHEEAKKEHESIIKKNIVDRRESRPAGSAIQEYLARGTVGGCPEVPEQSDMCVQSPDLPEGTPGSQNAIGRLLSGQGSGSGGSEQGGTQ